MKARYPLIVVFVAAVGSAAVAFAGVGGPETKLISRNSAGDPASGGYSTPGGITPNGRWVAFESDADNLPGAYPDDYQIYVRDRKTGQTKLVSKSGNGDPGDDGSYDPGISDDGRFVNFESYATNFPGSLGPTYLQVFVRDLKNGTTKLISRTTGGGPATGGYSEDSSISGNGRWVAFESDADNLPGANSDDQIYVRDRQTGPTRLVSQTTGGTPATTRLGPGDHAERRNRRVRVRRVKPSRGSRHRRSSLCPEPRAGQDAPGEPQHGRRSGRRRLRGLSISGNGRFVEFESYATNLPGSLGPTYRQVYLRDRKQDKTILVSRNSGGDAATGGSSGDGSVSANGRFVEFDSYATNLPGASGDTLVYLRDRDTGSTKLVSRSNNGDPANDDSYTDRNNNLLSRDPRFALFYSYATNLPGSTGPTYSQAYVRGPGP